MADGIRIRPRADIERQLAEKGVALAGAMFTVRDHDRPVPGANGDHECPICVMEGNGPRWHAVKTYHLRLDATGAIIVSTGVWDGLQRCADNPFEVVNHVVKPPTQNLLLVPAVIARSHHGDN